jgi:hypothetical protein
VTQRRKSCVREPVGREFRAAIGHVLAAERVDPGGRVARVLIGLGISGDDLRIRARQSWAVSARRQQSAQTGHDRIDPLGTRQSPMICANHVLYRSEGDRRRGLDPFAGGQGRGGCSLSGGSGGDFL